MARREIEPGQKYQQPGARTVWVVVDLLDDAEGIQHARLRRDDDLTSVKMISVSALKDGRLYRQLEE
jgi:hypothetical protein